MAVRGYFSHIEPGWARGELPAAAGGLRAALLVGTDPAANYVRVHRGGIFRSRLHLERLDELPGAQSASPRGALLFRHRDPLRSRLLRGPGQPLRLLLGCHHRSRRSRRNRWKSPRLPRTRPSDRQRGPCGHDHGSLERRHRPVPPGKQFRHRRLAGGGRHGQLVRPGGRPRAGAKCGPGAKPRCFRDRTV